MLAPAWNDPKDHGIVAPMKSVVYSRTGDPLVLRVVDRDVTEPGPSEVRVRIVVWVNPTDWESRLGSGGGAAPLFPEITPNRLSMSLTPASRTPRPPLRKLLLVVST